MGPSYSTPAVAGSGAIACGLAACATATGKVRLLARSDASAWRAEEQAQSQAAKLTDGDPSRIKVTTNVDDLLECDLVVEAIVEDLQTKTELLARLGTACPDADLASTTSALRIGELGEGSGHAERMFGLHVFNPVTRMELVELCLPDGLRNGIAARARAWCAAMGKTPIEVPDQSGFVVNRLLFPYLFDAVRLMESTGISAEDVDACMTAGAAHPMGPLALLDFVGLDVAMAIGEALYDETGSPAHEPPQLLRAYVGERKFGRKSGAGFYTY
jgi:3-hydroxybutyryl-CoA dehydrogenase